MDVIKEMVNDGFLKINNYIANMYNTNAPWIPAQMCPRPGRLTLPLNFNQCLLRLQAAAYSTTYERHRRWFKSNFGPRDSVSFPSSFP
jgi:hypothetical protein